MPKDQTSFHPAPAAQASTSASAAMAAAAAAAADGPLKRNQACLTCRRRKIRCDAEKPACGTCMRSWKHKLLHLPAGREAPPMPVCDYEPDEPDVAPPKKTRSVPVPSTSGSSSVGGGSSSSRKKGKEVELENRIHHLEDMLRLAVGAGVGNLGPGELQQVASGSTPGLPHDILRPDDILFSSAPPPQPALAPLPSPPLFQHQNSSDSFLQPPVVASPVQIWGPYDSPDSAAPSISATSGSSRSLPASGMPTTFDFSSPHAREGSKMTPDSMDSPDDYLTELLWPGWPPHLPHPGLMDHLAQVFLNSVPVVQGLFNPGRFLSRLSLPPTHDKFHHPAVLHAACALAARYTAVVQMSPPNQFKPQLTRTAAQRLEEKPLPLSDGLGQLADGADDFGAIHARWASVYFKSSEDHPAEWLSLATAAILLAVYFHSAGLLVEAWAWIGQATRLAVPLGLNTDSKRFSPGPQLTCPPADEIERIERINLWWLIFSMDSFATAGSGWNGAIHLLDVSTPLPAGSGRAPSPSAQNMFSADLLTSHPLEHANGVSLRIKATILLRKAADYTRSMEARGIQDLRQDPVFVELDRIIMRFGESFPPTCRDPLKASDDFSGRSVDQDLYFAHCLWPTALLILHCGQLDSENANSHSTSQIRLACNILLDRVFRLSATSVDPVMLSPSITLTYFTPAKLLLRLMTSAVEAGDFQTATRLQAEVEVFRAALARIGEKLPIGVRHGNMLTGIIQMLEERFKGKESYHPPGAEPGHCAQMRFSRGGGTAGPGGPLCGCIESFEASCGPKVVADIYNCDNEATRRYWQ